MDMKARCARCGKMNTGVFKGEVALLDKENCEHFYELWPKNKIFAFVAVTFPPDKQRVNVK